MKLNEEKLSKYWLYRTLVMMFTENIWIKVDGKWKKVSCSDEEWSVRSSYKRARKNWNYSHSSYKRASRWED